MVVLTNIVGIALVLFVATRKIVVIANWAVTMVVILIN